MEQQVRDFMPHLHPGQSYLFEHKRKGPFVGVYQGTQPTRGDDPEDTLFLDIDIITEDGSGQERIANAYTIDEYGRKMRPVFSKKLIRPSLLRSISSPSTEAKRALLAKYNQVRDNATKKAKELGTEPVLPVLSLPTDKAMDKLGIVEKKPSFMKRLFGGK